MAAPGRWRQTIVGFFCLVLPLVSLWYHGRARPEPTLIERFLMRLTSPAQHAMSGVVGSVTRVFTDYFWLVGVVEENRDLRRQNDVLAGLVQDRDQLKKENRRLKDLLRFKGERPDLQTVAAQVIAKDVSPYHRVLKVALSAGLDDGLERFQPVITPSGLVGHVERALGRYAEVKLAVDSDSRVAASVVGRDIKGTLVGAGDRGDFLAYFETLGESVAPGEEQRPLRPGDRLVTSGEDERYPKGLAIGQIADGPPKQSDLGWVYPVIPSVNFRTLDLVQIVVDHIDTAPLDAPR